MGDVLMAGMLIGAIGGAIKNNSASAIKDACSGFSQQNEKLNDSINTWTKITQDQSLLNSQLKKFGATLTNDLVFYKQKKLDIHAAFRQQEKDTMVIISIFIFVIILSLLMKYFNVYGNIWKIIVGK